MTQSLTTPATEVTADHRTRTLLRCGVLAGPIFAAVGLVQAATRDGFDIRHHTLSLLSNGSLGWIQITNFLLTGTLIVAAAIGLRRVFASGRGAKWAPRLVGTFGLGLIGGGLFVADPMHGFPIGAPAGAPDPMTWHGGMHLVTGSIGFLALIVGCFVVARRFAAQGQKAWARYSVVTGVVFFAAFAGISSGSSAVPVNLAFVVAVFNALGWITAVCAHLYRRAG
jgi:hypothetical membrane protein